MTACSTCRKFHGDEGRDDIGRPSPKRSARARRCRGIDNAQVLLLSDDEHRMRCGGRHRRADGGGMLARPPRGPPVGPIWDSSGAERSAVRAGGRGARLGSRPVRRLRRGPPQRMPVHRKVLRRSDIVLAHHGALSVVTTSPSGSSSTICERLSGNATAPRTGRLGTPAPAAQCATPSPRRAASNVGFVRHGIQPRRPPASNSHPRPRTRYRPSQSRTVSARTPAGRRELPSRRWPSRTGSCGPSTSV